MAEKSPCNHHALRGWALEDVFTPDGTRYWRCRRCGGVFFDRWPLEEALTREPQVHEHSFPLSTGVCSCGEVHLELGPASTGQRPESGVGCTYDL